MIRWALLAALLFAAPAAFAQQIELPVYPGVVHTRIGSDLMIGGHPHRMAYFVTRDSLKTVADYFYKHWSEEGYPTFEDGDLEVEGVVSAFMTREGIIRSVVLRKHGDKTLGFTVLRDTWIAQAPQKNDPGPLAPLEGAIFSGDFGANDGQGTTRQRTQIVKGDLDSVRGELMKRMQLQGFSVMRETGEKVDGVRQLVLEHSGPGQQVITVLAPVEGSYVAVTQSWVGSDRLDAVPNDVAVKALREKLAKEKKQ